jgi:multidrug transporter EmrE-like cation transporter
MKKGDIIDRTINSINWKVGKFNTLPILFGAVMAVIDIAMMSTLKMINTNKIHSSWGTPLAVGLYALEPLVFLKALNYEGMAMTNLVWNLMSNVIVTLQGIFIFGESVKGLRWLAVCMSILSLALMAYTGND